LEKKELVIGDKKAEQMVATSMSRI